MARLPRGMDAKIGKVVVENGLPIVEMVVTIKWWAWPGLFLAGVRDFSWPWYRWPLVIAFILQAWLRILWAYLR